MNIEDDGKLYYRISEVCKKFDIPTSTLRYWEKEFKQLKPKRTQQKHRLYTKADIEMVGRIYHLLYKKGISIAQAKRELEYPVSDGEHFKLEGRAHLRNVLQLLEELYTLL